MSFRSWFAHLQVARTLDRLTRERRRSPRRRRASPFCFHAEVLEARTLLSAYTAASASALIADINAANKAGGTNTITLAANTTFDLTAVNNTTNGANGLPVIGANKAVNLTISGNGDTIDRSTAAGTPAFRLFDVGKRGSLTLESVTLQNGLAQGSGAAADGGAIYNQGSLTLIGATVQDNAAEGASGADGAVIHDPKSSQLSLTNGQAGSDAAGGGIWSSGSATLEGGAILQQNEARGGQGGTSGAFSDSSGAYHIRNAGAGGGGFGGGVYEAAGSVKITGATLTANTAAGGTGGGGIYTRFGYGYASHDAPSGAGGVGAGGGLYTAAGTLNVSSVIVQANQALGGTGGATNAPQDRGSGDGYLEVPGNGGVAYGGGIDVAGGTGALPGTELLSNVAQGGTGGQGPEYGVSNGGSAFGGGLYAGGGTLVLTSDTVTGNEAFGGPLYGLDYLDVVGYGGGIEIASLASVSLDSFTVTNTTNNFGGIGPNIDGTYILLP